MKNKTQNIHGNKPLSNRKSIRLKGYDYSETGLYFITICCDDRKSLFGKITNGEMIFNEAGKVANECWQQIPEHFPNVIFHEYIIMPNHIHGIIELKSEVNENNNVRVQNFEPRLNEFQKIIPHSIGSIIRGFKIGVTKGIRQNPQTINFPPIVRAENFQPQRLAKIWQRNYYEHIIRNEQSYQNISNYIINNPSKWNDDKFFL